MIQQLLSTIPTHVRIEFCKQILDVAAQLPRVTAGWMTGRDIENYVVEQELRILEMTMNREG